LGLWQERMLIKYVMAGNIGKSRKLIEQGIDVNLINAHVGFNLLYLAANKNNPEMVRSQF
jgi:ankyrin repeat protein